MAEVSSSGNSVPRVLAQWMGREADPERDVTTTMTTDGSADDQRFLMVKDADQDVTSTPHRRRPQLRGDVALRFFATGAAMNAVSRVA